MTDWRVYVAIATAVTSLLWSRFRLLRLCAVAMQLAVLAQYGVFLANVGRNTFDHVQRAADTRDTFRQGVFAEAKVAERFAREQLSVVYIASICLAALALWPALARRKSTVPAHPKSEAPLNEATEET